VLAERTYRTRMDPPLSLRELAARAPKASTESRFLLRGHISPADVMRYDSVVVAGAVRAYTGGIARRNTFRCELPQRASRAREAVVGAGGYGWGPSAESNQTVDSSQYSYRRQ
jgi:hypothetical protein